MRKHLSEKFNVIYLLNLGGDIQEKQPGDSNVFNITVGVSIALLVKTGEPVDSACIFYNNEAELRNKAQTFDFLNRHQNVGNVSWEQSKLDDKNRWITKGLQEDFEYFVPMGTKEAKDKEGIVEDVIFKDFSLGVSTNRDFWVYNFNKDSLRENVKHMIETYNAEVDRWERLSPPKPKVDDFVLSDATKIKWSRDLKEKKLMHGRIAEYTDDKIRSSLYRPFTKTDLFLDKILIDSPGQFPYIFPTSEAERENRVICVEAYGRKEFTVLMCNIIPNLNLYGDPQQSFPFYTYNEGGTNRRENITDWALAEFQDNYSDDKITKWDIFYYTYGFLHHKGYRDKYQEDLKNSLPHIPFAVDFWTFSEAGRQLADLHVNYDSVPKYEGLTLKEKPGMPLNWNVEKMKLSQDKTQIKYNDFLTIEGIPVEAHHYKLSTRSAFAWIVNQYEIKVDKDRGNRKGSYNVRDPNREDEPKYIVDLIARVVTVSLETVKIVEGLPDRY